MFEELMVWSILVSDDIEITDLLFGEDFNDFSEDFTVRSKLFHLGRGFASTQRPSLSIWTICWA